MNILIGRLGSKLNCDSLQMESSDFWLAVTEVMEARRASLMLIRHLAATYIGMFDRHDAN